MKCIGGELIGRLWPRDDDERQAALDAGYDLDSVLTSNDLISGDDVFFSATGVTDGDVLQGVRYPSAGRRDDRIACDALTVGHDPPDLSGPRPHEAPRARRRPLARLAPSERAGCSSWTNASLPATYARRSFGVLSASSRFRSAYSRAAPGCAQR